MERFAQSKTDRETLLDEVSRRTSAQRCSHYQESTARTTNVIPVQKLIEGYPDSLSALIQEVKSRTTMTNQPGVLVHDVQRMRSCLRQPLLRRHFQQASGRAYSPSSDRRLCMYSEKVHSVLQGSRLVAIGPTASPSEHKAGGKYNC